MEKAEMNIRAEPLMEKEADHDHIKMSKALKSTLTLSDGDVIAIRGEKNYVLLSVVPLEEKDTLYAYVSSSVLERISGRYPESRKPYFNTLGADPEFVLEGSETVCGKEFLALDKTITINLGIAASKTIPKYADYCLGEIRPSPAYTANKLVSNIRHELKCAYEEAKKKIKMPKFKASTKEGRNYVGYHIHFGYPQRLFTLPKEESDNCIKVLVSILDSSVGIVSRLDPCSYLRNGRNEMKYGQLGDYKLNLRTFEYRVPGGYWLVSPGASLSLLEYAQGIFHKAITAIIDSKVKHKQDLLYAEIRKKFRNLPSETLTKMLYSQREVDEDFIVNIVGSKSCLAVKRKCSPYIDENWEL